VCDKNIFTVILLIINRIAMKKYVVLLLLTAAVSLQTRAGNITGINEKLVQSFKQTFPQAAEVNWQELADSYVVNFTEGPVRTRITYDKEGNFTSSIRYYKETNLPVNILCKIKKRYANEKVFGVTELTSDSHVEYYVKMENATNWITVKSDGEGNMEQVEKYKKTE
jgi:hypothetical protein